MIVDCALYQDGVRRPGPLPVDEACEQAARTAGGFAWIGLYEPTWAEFDRVRGEFDFHELAVEDAVKAHQRPKVEVYGDSLFVVLKTARYDDQAESIEFGEIMLFIGSNFVVTVRHGRGTALSDVRRAVEGRPELLRCGPGAVLHAVVDRVVDDYFPVLDGLDNDIQEVERDVFSPEATNPAERIYKLKREVLDFHRNTAPLLEALDRLAQGRFGVVEPELGNYFRDVTDHLLRVVSQIESFRDLLTSVLEANLTQISVRQNEDMRKISAVAAMAAVPTLLAGVWGMNFARMPELDEWWGYPFALATMVVSVLLVYVQLKRAGWL